eukprot:TRINITY_DN395_c2_g1_i2.p1 TRINITY_DN395_c2_g1~~TRINITY_DN395_c2_g1_i2.p1  ORF type:complete len:448 (+),score=105.44 TRINITY_DN395_c2_g1_i2:65-1345(+)
MPTEISRSVGGTEFKMNLSDEEMKKLECCVSEETGGTIQITHDGDLSEDVHCLWLLGVMGRFKDCKKIMSSVGHSDEESRMEMLHFAQTLFSSEDEDDEDAQDSLRQAFLGGKKGWEIPIDDLFEDYQPDVVRECVELGFTISKESLDNNKMDVTVSPQSHEVAIIFALATRHIEWDPTDLTPFNSQSDFCPADVFLLQHLIRSKLVVPTDRTTFHWVGHLFWAACVEVGVTDSQFKAIVVSDSFWEYISDRSVPKLELLVRESGKPVQYKSRLERIIKNFLEEESDDEIDHDRKEILINAVKHHFDTKPAKKVDELFHDFEGASIQQLIQFFDPSKEGEQSSKSPFEQAAEAATSLKKLSNETKLQIYALYKQTTEGDNTRKQPGMFDFEGKAKWAAWNTVKGTSKEEASSKYVELIAHLQSEQK